MRPQRPGSRTCDGTSDGVRTGNGHVVAGWDIDRDARAGSSGAGSTPPRTRRGLRIALCSATRAAREAWFLGRDSRLGRRAEHTRLSRQRISRYSDGRHNGHMGPSGGVRELSGVTWEVDSELNGPFDDQATMWTANRSRRRAILR